MILRVLLLPSHILFSCTLHSMGPCRWTGQSRWERCVSRTSGCLGREYTPCRSGRLSMPPCMFPLCVYRLMDRQSSDSSCQVCGIYQGNDLQFKMGSILYLENNFVNNANVGFILVIKVAASFQGVGVWFLFVAWMRYLSCQKIDISCRNPFYHWYELFRRMWY